MTENKKTPQSENQEDFKIGGYPTAIKIPLSFACDEFNIVGVLTVEIYNPTAFKTSIHDVIERGCETLLTYFKE